MPLTAVLLTCLFGRDSFGSIQYVLPKAWEASKREGHLVLAPKAASPELASASVLYPAAQLGPRGFEAWFKVQLGKNLGPQSQVLQGGSMTRGTANGQRSLSLTRRIRDAEGSRRIQAFYAVSNGKEGALLMTVYADDRSKRRFGSEVAALSQSLRLR